MNWSSGSADVAWANSDAAVFGLASDTDTGTYTVTLGSAITAAGLTFNAGPTYTIAGTNVLTLSGTSPTITTNGAAATISAVIGGTAGLTTAGTGTLLLSGANTYSGTTNVSAGTLQIGNGIAGSISSSSAVNVSSGATLALNLANNAAFSNAIAINGTLVGAETAGVTNSITGVLTGTGGFTQSGAGTTIFNSSTSPSYTGPTVISAGILETQHTNSIPGGIGNTGGTSNINLSGGVLAIGYSNPIFARGLGSGVAQVQFAPNTNSGFAAVYTTGTQVINIGGASATLVYGVTPYWLSSGSQLTLGASIATGNTNFQNNLDLAGTTQTINVVRGTSPTYDGQLSGVISDGALTVTGNGVLALTGVNTYAGQTTVSSGTLQIGNGTTGSISNSSSSSIVNVATAAAAVFDQATSTIANTMVDNGTIVATPGIGVTMTFSGGITGTGGFNQSGPGTTIFTTTAKPYAGPTQITAGVLAVENTGVLAGGFASNTTGTSNIVFAGGVLGIGYNNTTFTRALGTGTSQTQFAAGTNGGFACYSGSSTYTVNIGGSSAALTFGSTPSWLSSGSQLILGSAGDQGLINFQNPLNFNNVAQTIDVVHGAPGTAIYDGQLSGVLSNGSLNVVGNGLLEVTGNNTFGGGTAISGGTLVANTTAAGNSSTGTGTVTINTGGTLAGTGRAGNGGAGVVNVVGGTITAGTGSMNTSSAGTLTTGSQNWSSGSYVAKYDATGKVDLLIMNGLTVASSGFVINFQTFNGSSAGVPANTYELAEDTEAGSANPFNASGSMPALGELTLKVNGLAAPAGYTLSTAVDTTDAGGGFALTLVVATPEPTSLLLAAVAAAPLAMGRRRRRASAAAV